MAESILFSRVDKILGKVTTLAAEQIWVAWDLEAELNKLRTTLSGIKAVVLDAEDQPSSNHRIALWLNHLKHVLYDAEDVLDDVAYQALRNQVVGATSSGFIYGKKVHRFFSTSNTVAYRFWVGRKIKELRLRLDDIAALKAQFNLAHCLDNRCTMFPVREMTHSFVNTSFFVGRDRERETIVQFLMDSGFQGGHEHDNVSVMAVVGIGGLGKTALAQMVFNDPRLVPHFGKKVWVCLGDVKKFSVDQVMGRVFKDITGEVSVDNSNPQQQQSIIHNNLRDTKFLLILDDMWDVNHERWLELKALLACGAQGSKIVVTTRISSIASCVSTIPAQNLKGLAHEECVSLFKRLAFANCDEVDDNLMKIGDEIVRKCKGVPMAVRSLGSMLFLNSDEREWLSVRDSGIWKLEGIDDDIIRILRFSYDHLPSHLKQCFVYCSIFPQDYEFNELLLISFWMAHGLLQSSNTGKEPEYVGKQYIKELLSRGFFQDLKEVGLEWRFKIHDLVRDLACSLGEGEFATINENEKDISSNTRHVYVEKEQQFSCSSNNAIRTVIVGVEVSYKFVEACISKFKNLRVFWLKYSKFKKLPTSIGSLKHLRSFELFYCTRLKRLPDSICKLHNLEYASFEGCRELEEVPESIGELINLRCLWITILQKHLPKRNGIGSLASLRLLVIERCPNLEVLFGETQLQLQSLQTLIVLGATSLKCLCRMNSQLPALEYLLIRYCESPNLNLIEDDNVNHNCSSVSRWLHLPRLKSLRLQFLVNLEGLPEWIEGCAGSLELLEIFVCPGLEALPEWLADFTSLRTLKINSCYNLACLPGALQHLTALKELEISNCGALWERCSKKGGGEDWIKIAHVPNIKLLP